MYSLNEKENAIELMKKETDVEEIILTTGISKSTILRWKKELELRKHIKQLIESGKLEEAKKEVEKITGKVNEPIRNSILIKIARKEGDRDTEKRLVDRQLELNPNDIKAMSSRIRIAREERDINTEKRLVNRRLELEPDNVIAIRHRIEIAKEEGDRKLQQQLIKKLAEIRLTKDRELEDLLTQQYISQEKTDSQRTGPSTIKQVRTLIYDSPDIVQASEQIKELLEGQDELDREIALAELFIKTRLQARAEKSLKAYKRKIEDLPEKQENLRKVKKALELVRNSKAKKFQWDELWKTLENRQTTNHAKKELDER